MVVGNQIELAHSCLSVLRSAASTFLTIRDALEKQLGAIVAQLATIKSNAKKAFCDRFISVKDRPRQVVHLFECFPSEKANDRSPKNLQVFTTVEPGPPRFGGDRQELFTSIRLKCS